MPTRLKIQPWYQRMRFLTIAEMFAWKRKWFPKAYITKIGDHYDLSGIKIKTAIVFTGLYRYITIPFISEGGEKYVKLGCYTRKLSEWEADFWNNPNEFSNDGSEKSQLRLFAFETAKKWLEIIQPTEKGGNQKGDNT